MDRRTTLALVLCMLVFAVFTALQGRFAPKPKPAATADSSAVAAPATPAPAAPTTPVAAPAGGALASAAPTSAVTPRTFVLETPLYRATFSNIGARLQSVELKRFAAAWGASRYGANPKARPKRGNEVPEGDRVVLGGGSGNPAFAFDLGSGTDLGPLASMGFAVEESTSVDGSVVALTFTARDSAGNLVRQTWRSEPDSYRLFLDVAASGPTTAGKDWTLTARSWPLLSESDPTADMRSVRAVSLVDGKLHRDGAQGMVNKSDKTRDGSVRWAGVQTHYFMGIVSAIGADGRRAVARGQQAGVTPEQAALLPANAKKTQPVAEGALVMSAPASGSQRFAVYFGPSDYFGLAKVSGAGRRGSLQLEKAVDLGMSWIVPFSYPMLVMLRWLDGLVRNFGLAIFLLATVVRLVLHPLNMSSMKSMRAMTRLQPEMDRIREKFKNKPEAMNAAIMALYKENKVNPAGGCLPMLLQMPLFFALYAVLFNAIELRQAPFFGWIHDLAAPDQLLVVAGMPLNVLPLIMTATGFLQQKLTPTPSQQASTMYLMNFFMLFIFYGLPSGLVFYWTVMNLYTALQQWLVMRGDDGVVVPAGTGSARG
jgi:YidC/Oxa1 family membrane protein insertase